MPEPIILSKICSKPTITASPWKRLRGVSFAVQEGEVFGLLGPNGAGKTTTVEILEGMRTPDRGSARVCGLDPEKAGAEFKQRIGAVLQSTPCRINFASRKRWTCSQTSIANRANTE